MKKAALFMTAAMVLAVFLPVKVAYANSAQMERQTENGYFEFMAVNDPELTVESEVLTFDFSNGFDDSPTKGVVTAEYNIKNSGADKSVTMGFPLLSSVQSVNERQTAVTINGQTAEYKPYYAFGDNAQAIANASFEDVLTAINEIELIDEDRAVSVFSISLENRLNANNIRVTFDVNYDVSRIFQSNFNGYANKGRDNEGFSRIELSAFTQTGKSAAIYVFGETPKNFKVKATQGDNTTAEYETDEVIVQDTVTAKDFINSIKKDMDESEYRLASSKVLEYIGSGQEMVFGIDEVYRAIFESECIALLGYTVNLKSGGNVLRVSYIIEGGYNAYYKPTVYNFKYISSPAKNWESFGSLTVNIITSGAQPYVIFSSLAFEKMENNRYVYIGGVPDENISFSLCQSEEPVYDEGGKNVYKMIIIFVAVIALAAAGAVAATVVIIVRKKKLKGR